MLTHILPFAIVGILAGLSVPVSSPPIENDCEEAQACLHAASADGAPGVWTSPYARQGICGCNDASSCIEKTTCRAWYSFSHLNPGGSWSKSSNGDCKGPGQIAVANLASTGCDSIDTHNFIYDCTQAGCTVGCSLAVLAVGCSENNCPGYDCD